MDFDGNFRAHGRVDVEALRDAVLAETEEAWTQDSYRQQSFSIHAATQTIPLLFDRDFRHARPTRAARYAELEPLIAPILDFIATRFDRRGFVVRCLLIQLRPGGRIAPHIDAGDSLTRSHRIHVPIVTNPRVVFVVGDEPKAMRAGEVWEINNKRPHAVRNLGSTPRVHLVCDWAPEEASRSDEMRGSVALTA